MHLVVVTVGANERKGSGQGGQTPTCWSVCLRERGSTQQQPDAAKMQNTEPQGHNLPGMVAKKRSWERLIEECHAEKTLHPVRMAALHLNVRPAGLASLPVETMGIKYRNQL